MEHTAADVNYKRKKNGIRKDSANLTPLTAACGHGNLNIVRYLLETSRVDANLPDCDNYTPLNKACASVKIPVSIYLLTEVSDLDISIVDRYGNTALHNALWCCKDFGYTQLHVACRAADFNEVLKLVSLGGHNINAQDNTGDTPLHWASKYGYSDIVQALMLAGADETINNMFLETPVQLAKSRGHSELLKFLDRVSLWEVLQANKLAKMPVKFIMM